MGTDNQSINYLGLFLSLGGSLIMGLASFLIKSIFSKLKDLEKKIDELKEEAKEDLKDTEKRIEDNFIKMNRSIDALYERTDKIPTIEREMEIKEKECDKRHPRG